MSKNHRRLGISGDVNKMMNVIVVSLLNQGRITFQDKEDFKQDLVLFFLENCQTFADERELVFVALKNKATNILKYSSYRNHSSLEALIENGCDFADSDTLESLEQKMSINKVFENLNATEHKICQAILDGLSFNEITRQCHVSKSTIYKVFESIKRKK